MKFKVILILFFTLSKISFAGTVRIQANILTQSGSLCTNTSAQEISGGDANRKLVLTISKCINPIDGPEYPSWEVKCFDITTSANEMLYLNNPPVCDSNTFNSQNPVTAKNVNISPEVTYKKILSSSSSENVPTETLQLLNFGFGTTILDFKIPGSATVSSDRMRTMLHECISTLKSGKLEKMRLISKPKTNEMMLFCE